MRLRVREHRFHRIRECNLDRVRERCFHRIRECDLDRVRERNSDRIKERSSDRVRERGTDRVRGRYHSHYNSSRHLWLVFPLTFAGRLRLYWL